jgi:hypothetical protein
MRLLAVGGSQADMVALPIATVEIARSHSHIELLE